MSDPSSVILAIASLVTAVGVAYNAISTARRDAKLASKVDTVHSEVVTANGRTLGMLADAMEGRRIVADVDQDDRTDSEQGYVDRLDIADR